MCELLCSVGGAGIGTAIRSKTKLGFIDAALANGLAAQALDYDCARGQRSHPRRDDCTRRAGFDCAPDGIEGQLGFGEIYSGLTAPEAITRALGASWAIAWNG
jgi:hypothetical protein